MRSEPALASALGHLERALARKVGRALFAPFHLPLGDRIAGRLEVRSCRGVVRRFQDEVLPLPQSLVRALSLAAPRDIVQIEVESHTLTLWPPRELIELQAGYRWHGFTGRPMSEWDERFVVFAEDGGDPLALRLDQADGPVWIAPRGEGRPHFSEAAPDLAAFFEALALWCEAPDATALAPALSDRFGARAAGLWLWREVVSRESARR